MSRQQMAARFGVLKDMVGGGQWLPGEWTDDTAMMLAVAEGLMESPRDPVEAIGRRFLEWFEGRPKDVGNTIREALARFDGDWPSASRSTPQARRGRAAGNGSLMRSLPVAFAYRDHEEMLIRAAGISDMTHWDPQARIACRALCLWIRYFTAWNGTALDSLVASLRLALSDATRGGTENPEFEKRMLRAPTLQESDIQPSGYAGYVVECFEAVVWCVCTSNCPEETIIKAVNLGGETDTIAAIAGGVAGAYYGKLPPERWLNELHDRERIERAAMGIAAL